LSSESFRKFLAQVQENDSLKQEFRAAGGEAGMAVETMVAFAAGKGYDFKVEDVSSELSDQQLDSVAGGWGDPHVDRNLSAVQGAFPKVEVFPKVESMNTYLSSAGNLMVKI